MLSTAKINIHLQYVTARRATTQCWSTLSSGLANVSRRNHKVHKIHNDAKVGIHSLTHFDMKMNLGEAFWNFLETETTKRSRCGSLSVSEFSQVIASFVKYLFDEMLCGNFSAKNKTTNSYFQPTGAVVHVLKSDPRRAATHRPPQRVTILHNYFI